VSLLLDLTSSVRVSTLQGEAQGGVIRRVINGQRGPELLDGLGEVDTLLVTELLGRLGRHAETPDQA
jgi:hypothetical protein